MTDQLALYLLSKRVVAIFLCILSEFILLLFSYLQLALMLDMAFMH